MTHDSSTADFPAGGTARDCAAWYISRGWVPIPIQQAGKAPAISSWQQRTLDAARASLDADFAEPGSNVGVLLGEPSGGLVDIDLDCAEAYAIAGRFLPPTMFFSRGTSDSGHVLAICPGAKTEKFADPLARRGAKGAIIEIRATGAQTVFPGSTHPSGAHIVWDEPTRAIATVAVDDLEWRVRKIASAVLLGRHWPASGRHETQLALAGALISAGWPDSYVLEFLCATCKVASDEDAHKREHTVADTRAKFDAGEPVTGWTRLADLIDAKVVKAVRKWLRMKRTPSPSNADRPQILLGPDLHRIVDETIAQLPRDRALYQRDGHLVRVVRVAQPETPEPGRAVLAVGTPQIRDVQIATLRERLTRLISYGRITEDDDGVPGFVECVPDHTIVTAVAERAEWPGVPPIVGVIETPSMRPDGTVIDEPGYDAVTGYLYAPTLEYPRIRETPTWADAYQALCALCEPWQDFPFASPVMALVPLANLLSLVARPAIRGEVPGFVYDASVRGSGKSLTQKCVSLLATGRECALATWPRNEEELEKMLGSYALRGASVIAFDNVASKFGGAPLDKVLTASDRVDLRILGRSEIPELSWRAVVSASGNNIELGGDTTRRVLLARLEPTAEHPEERTEFKIPGGETGLRQWCRQHHPRLVADALTLLRAYVVAGRPQVEMRPWTYGAWSSLVPAAIRWAGGQDTSGAWVLPDVMTCRPTVGGDADEHTEALRVLLGRFGNAFPKGATSTDIIDGLWPIEFGFRARVDKDLCSAVETLCPGRPGITPTARQVGRALSRVRKRVVGGRCLDSTTDHGGSKRWFVRQVGG